MQVSKVSDKKPLKRVRDKGNAPNLSKVYDRFARIIEKESRQLLAQSNAGKLDKYSAADLVNYTKLLKTLLDDSKAAVGNMSEDDIEKALEAKKPKP